MKQFQNELKAKVHLKKIQNAKTTLYNKNIPNTNAKLENQQQISEIIKLYDAHQFNSIPVYKLLKHYNLQQYTREMILRGYGVNINRLAYITDNDRNKMFEDIKILPGHTLKLMKIIQQVKRKVTFNQTNDSINSARQHLFNKEQYKSNISNKIILKDNSDKTKEHQELLQRLLHQYSPLQSPGKVIIHPNPQINGISSYTNNFKKEKHQEKYKQPEKQKQKQKQELRSYKNQKNSISTVPTKISAQSAKRPLESFKKITAITNNEKKPISISKARIKLNPKQQTRYSNTTINKKLPQSLKVLSLEKKKQKIQIDLKIDNIKSLYMSVQGGIMTSTLVNLDLQQQCYCIAAYLQKKIQAAPRKVVQNKIQNYFQQIKLHEKNDFNQNQVQSILKQSFLHPLYKENSEENIQIQQEIDKSYQQNLQQQTGKLQESSFLGNASSVCFGLNNALDIFEEPTPSQIDYYIPTIDSLSNFIKNIVISAKMERQVPLLSVLYIQKFLKISQINLNSLNYKRILISCLLLASKVWDDESFQTPSFSHTFPDYTTVLLNQLEKQILVTINYELKLNKKQYALLYYKLRAYRSSKTKSYKNRALNIVEVRQLQKGIKKQYRRDFLTKRNSF